MKKGFTLIELLVVVLIIGILSAVALPQYQKAVDKTKYHQIMALVDGVAKAQEVYYLANGTYSNRFENLDISIPNSFNSFKQDLLEECVSNSKGEILCTSSTYTYGEPWASAAIQYFRTYANSPKPNRRVCNVNTASTQKERWINLCKSLGKSTNETFFAGQPAWDLN